MLLLGSQARRLDAALEYAQWVTPSAALYTLLLKESVQHGDLFAVTQVVEVCAPPPPLHQHPLASSSLSITLATTFTRFGSCEWAKTRASPSVNVTCFRLSMTIYLDPKLDAMIQEHSNTPV